MSRFVLPSVGFTLAILLAGQAQAQTQAQTQTGAQNAAAASTTDTSLTIGEIVVTADRQTEISKVLTSVDVLSGSIAQRENVDATFQLFSRLPGVLTTNFGQGPSTAGAISFRGFNGEGGINAVKVLIDGVPSNTNDGFSWMLDALQPMDIDRIEVVRGTSDPRYGLHNIAGNVNISTRQGGTYVDAKASGGSFGTYDGQVSAGYETGAFTQNYFVGYRHTGGYRDHAEGDRFNISGKWFYNGDGFSIGAIARYYHGKGQEPGFLTAEDAAENPRQSYPVSATDGGNRKIQHYSLHFDADVTSQLSARAKLFMIDFDDTRFVRFSESISQQERITKQRQYGGLAALNWKPDVGDLLHSLSFEVGADFQIQDNHLGRYLTTERVRNSYVIAQYFDFSNYGGYIQAVIEPTDWLRITPAYRFDRIEGSFDDRIAGSSYPANDYGTIGQPKISAAITPIEGVTAYGNYGRTFQVGLGSASYLIPPQTTNLRPSYNDGWELGLKLSQGSWFEGRIAAWKQVATGEVLYNELTAVYTNIGQTRRIGFDAQANFKPASDLNLWVAVSKQHGRITAPNPAAPEQLGNKINHVPEFILSGGVEYRPSDQIRLTLTGNGQSNYEIDTSNLPGRFGGYAVFNAEIAYRLNPKVEIAGQIRNLTNDRYDYVWWDGEKSLHAPADARAAYASLRITL